MLPASGRVTASANAVATAASTALPPLRMMSVPACEASGSSLTTTPCGAVTAALSGWNGQVCSTEEGPSVRWQPTHSTSSTGKFFVILVVKLIQWFLSAFARNQNVYFKTLVKNKDTAIALPLQPMDFPLSLRAIFCRSNLSSSNSYSNVRLLRLPLRGFARND